MVRRFLKWLILRYKEIFFQEAQNMQGFLYLLFKPINTNQEWNKEEKRLLLKHLKRLSFYVPGLFIFTLPGGSLMLPLLAEILDRRKTRRFSTKLKSSLK